MKRLLLACAVLLMSVSAVQAGMNIRQNGDGSTDWEDASGNRFNVGASYLTVHIENISSASSAAIAIPIPNSKITSIRSAIVGTIASSDATFNFYAGTGLTDGSVSTSNEVSNGTGPLTITASGSNNGDVDTFTPTTQNSVTAGDVLLIRVNGESTNDVDAWLTITVEPNGT